MHFSATLGELAGQRNHFRDHQLGDAAGVAEWRVEHRNAAAVRRVQVNLVGPNAKATQRKQSTRVADGFGGDLRLAADAQDMDIFEAALKFVFFEGVRQCFDLVALMRKERLRCLVHIFQKQHFDLLFGKRRNRASLSHGDGSLRRRR